MKVSDWVNRFFGVIFIVVLFTLVGLFLQGLSCVAEYIQERARRLNGLCVESTVVSVGGCDKYGECGVMFANGAKGVIYYPVVGQKLNVKEPCIEQQPN